MAVTLIESSRYPASSFECKRLYSRIEKILTDAGLKITDKHYSSPEDHIKNAVGTPGANDPNAFFEIEDGKGGVSIFGYTYDEYETPQVSVEGTLPREVVSSIESSVRSVEGWEFDGNHLTPVKESSQNKSFRYRGYIIRKRQDLNSGETRFDIINPAVDKKSPVWTDCGSADEAKLWINSDKAGKSESLNESDQEGWSVKHFSFDAAMKGRNVSADSLGLNGASGSKFFNDLCEFLAEHGMEMAGDYVDAEDVTYMYEENGYEFFQSK